MTYKLETLVKQRQAIKDEIDELNGRLGELNAEILGQMNELGEKSVEAGGWTARRSRRSTFQVGIAEAWLKKSNKPTELKAAVMAEPKLDPKKFKTIFPDKAAEFTVLSENETLTIVETKN